MTKIIVRPRQGGKTTELINLMRRDSSLVMVTHSRRWADQLIQQHHGLGPHRFVSINELRSQSKPYYFPHDAKFIFDEVDTILSAITGGHEVFAFTITGELA